jgi:hypothetical protein
MPCLTRCTVLMMFAVLSSLVFAAQPSSRVPRTNKPLDIGSISMLEGGTLGGISSKEVKSVDTTLPSVPHSSYVHYVWDGSYLRIRPGQSDKDMWSKEAIAKNGWYVTADYSSKPPRIIVTEKPTLNSTWRFVAAPRWGEYYLKNENSPEKKDAWLVLEKRDKGYWDVDQALSDQFGYRRNRYWECVVRDAILTFDTDKREAFYVADIEKEDGK